MAERIQWQLDGQYNARAAFQSAKDDLTSVDQLSAQVSGGLQTLGAAAGAFVAFKMLELAKNTAAAAFEMARASAEADRLRNAFEFLTEQAGEVGDEMLASMKKASAGAISEADLIGAANRAIVLEVANTSEEMAQLVQVAIVKGRQLGVSAQQSFNDLVTGIGRMSPLILDNLGIVTGGEATFNKYAASIGKTADQLSDAERKQALLNKVLDEAKGLLADNSAAGADMASDFERMDASLANAKEALGSLFSPVAAVVAQAIADAAQAAADGMNAMAEAGPGELETIEMALAGINDQLDLHMRMLAQSEEGSAEWKIAIENVNAALERKSELLKLHAEASQKSTVAETEAGQAALEASLNFDHAAESLGLENAFAAQTTEAMHELALAQTRAANEAQQLELNARGAADGLSYLEALAWSTGGAVDELNMRMREFNALTGKIGAEQNRLMGQAESQARRLVPILGSEDAQAGLATWRSMIGLFIDDLEKSAIAGEITWEEVIVKAEEYGNMLFAQSDATIQAWEEQKRAGKSTFSDIEKEAKKAFSEIQNAVSSVLQGALDPGVGVDPDEILEKLGLREEAINENARRLADIAKNGLKDQDWLSDFRIEVPNIWQQIARASNPQEEAARLLKEFEMGLRPDLIDKEKAKERAKLMLMGGAKIKELTDEIAAELAAELGVSVEEAKAAVGSAVGGGGGFLGGKPMLGDAMNTDAKASAESIKGAGGVSAQSFSSGFMGWLTENKFADQIANTLDELMKNEATQEKWRGSGGISGKYWGEGFLKVVGGNVPQGLLDILFSKLAPMVQAGQTTTASTTGALP